MSKRKLSAVEDAGQTMTISLSAVPAYLQNGELFKCMHSAAAMNEEEASDGADQIEVPMSCVKPDQSITSVDDAWSLLRSLRYWIAGPDLPPSLVGFCLSPNGKELPSSFWKSFEHQFAHMEVLRKMATSNAKDPSAKLRVAIATGDVNLVRLVHETLKCKLPTNASVLAAQSGSFACLKYVQKDDVYWQDDVRTAIAVGSLEHLKSAVSQYQGLFNPWYACLQAAEGGKLSCLQYLFTLEMNMLSSSDHEIYCHHISSVTASRGYLDCLKFVVEEQGFPVNRFTIRDAVKGGHLECLKYLHGRGVEWGPQNCDTAAGADQLACLAYMHENGCPWDHGVCSNSAARGSLRCLQYAHEHGCDWTSATCAAAARHGNLACLQYAHEQGCPWGPDTCAAAAKGGHLDCLQYAHQHGCPWDAKTCAAAARAGRLNCLQYAHEQGCPWDDKAWAAACYHKHTACVAYMHDHHYLPPSAPKA